VQNIVKAGLDVFTVYEGLPSSTQKISGSIGQLTVYPNPVSDLLHMDLTEDLAGTDLLTIVDLFGRSVLTQSVTGIHQEISVRNLLPGIYMVQVSRDGRVVAVGKIVVD